MATKSYVDVLVIGAGPAGLMCAQGLQRAGVNVRIIDKRYVHLLVGLNYAHVVLFLRPNKVPAGQADGIRPRTIEVLQVITLNLRNINQC